MEDFKLKGKVVLDDSGFKSGLNDLKSQGESFGSSFKNSMFGAMTAANLATKGVELLVSTLRSAVSEFTLLDKNIAKVNTLLDQQILSSTNLRMELLRVSSATGIYASELANASYEALSAGVETQNLTGFIEEMTVLSQGGFTSVTQAVNVTTSIMNAYGKEVYTANEISDKLVKTQALGKTTVDELSRSLYNVVPSATAMNVGLDDVLASIAVLTASGTPTAQSTTQIRQALLEMGDEGSKVGKAIENLTGKSFKQLMKEGYSVSKVIKLLSEESEKGGKSIDELYSSAEAKNASISLAKKGVEDYTKAIDGIGKSAGEAEKAQKIAIDNLSFQWSALATQIRNDFIEEGGVFADLSKRTLDIISNVRSLIGYVRKYSGAVADFVVYPWKKYADFIKDQTPVLFDKKDKTIVENTVTEAPVTEPPMPDIVPVGTIDGTGGTGGGNKGKVQTPEQLAREAERAERERFLEEQSAYYQQRDIQDSEFKSLQLDKDIEFFNQVSEMRLSNWTDEEDLDRAYQDRQYEKFEEEQAFRLEQLEADLEFYANKKEYAIEYAETLADIKELEAQTIEKAVEREEQLKNRDLSFTQKVNKSKEQLIKGAYANLINTNDNMLKSLGKFFMDSISNMMVAHGAELLYTGIKDVAKGIAISANPATAGMGAPLIAAGKNEIAQSALFAVGAGAMKAFSGSDSGSSSSTGSSGSSNYTEEINDREVAYSTEQEKTVTIYTDGDMKDVMLSMLGTLNELSKDYNNIEIVSK